MPVAGNATMSREWYRWAHDITQRVGGVSGASTADLAASQFEDAGIEEVKLTAYRLADQVASMESTLSELRERLTQALRQIKDINEGQTL
jgi:hypothetical protein